MAVSPVNKDIRLYSADNIWGPTLGALAPLQSGAWGIGNANALSGGTVYAIEIATFVGDKSLPLMLEPARAFKIQWKSRDRGRAFTSRVLLMNPRTGATINLGGDQSGIVGISGQSFSSPTSNDDWCELIVNITDRGRIDLQYSRWATGEAPGTHSPAETKTASNASNVLEVLENGLIACVTDNATSLYKVRYWIGTPDAPPIGVASVATLAAAGWRWSGDPDSSMFPIVSNAVSGQHWRRTTTMARGGTHIGIVLFGIYGNGDDPIVGGYTTSVQLSQNGGAYQVLDAAAVVPAGDFKILTIPLVHNRGDTITWDGTQSAGTALPGMAGGGFYPYLNDDLGNTQGICFGVISLVNPDDGRYSVHCLTDSLGVQVAAESAYEAGCGVFNQSVGGCQILHIIGGDGGLKRYLLPFADIVMIKLSANDMNVGSATSATLFEREYWLMNMPGIKDKPIIRWFVPPCATPVHVALGGATWNAVKTQPRLHNSLTGPAYAYAKAIGRDLYGLYIDGSALTIEPGSMRVWKAGVSPDGIHYQNSIKTALKNYARDEMMAWLPTLAGAGSSGGNELVISGTTTTSVNESAYTQVAPTGGARIFNPSVTSVRVIVAASQPSGSAVGERIDETVRNRWEQVTTNPVWIKTERGTFDIVVSVP
ncbi:MAG: hypothetical protein QM758_06845 [Armatimonas sp.]